MPAELAAEVTRCVPVPTIGIGAGGSCDGQVLVFHDVVGWSGPRVPRFVRRYADLEVRAAEALATWAGDVRSGRFPSEQEAYRA